MLHGPIAPTLARLAWPNILMMLAQSSTGLIETWFLARLGTPANILDRLIVPSSHLGLYLGGQTLATAWPRIAGWLQAPGAVPIAVRL